MITLTDIQALPTELRATQDEVAIAAALSVGRVKIAEYLGGIGTVMETLGPVDGAALLDSLESMAATNSAVKWAFVLINRGELDFGSTATRAMIDQLVPSPAKEVLLAVAEVPEPVDVMTVRKLIWADTGEYLA